MACAGRFNGELMDYIREFIKPGVTTGEIDRLVHEQTIRQTRRLTKIDIVEAITIDVSC